MCLCENFSIRPLYLKLLNFVFSIEPLTSQAIIGSISQTKLTAPTIHIHSLQRASVQALWLLNFATLAIT